MGTSNNYLSLICYVQQNSTSMIIINMCTTKLERKKTVIKYGLFISDEITIECVLRFGI